MAGSRAEAGKIQDEHLIVPESKEALKIQRNEDGLEEQRSQL